MDYEQWSSLLVEMAVEAFVSDATEVMTPAAEARALALRIKAQSDKNVESGGRQVQNWRALQHHMGNALIALEKLGYTVEKKHA